MEGRQLREREVIALDLVGVVGLAALLLGLLALRTSEKLGFDPGGALEGVLGQLAVTLPVAGLIFAASALELGAGLVLARLARRTAFDSVAEALLAAMVAAVLKNTLLLGLLGGFGLFLAPVLIAVDVLIIVGGVFVPAIARHAQPLTSFRGWRATFGSVASVPVAALVAVVWAGPVILQLASPIVPFIDVLPNYVGPVEHLRTFGWFSPLTATQSPIIGPSRTVLGYDGLLGSLATITGLPGGMAIAGFILPQTILVGAGAHRLAHALRGGDPPVGAWALLAFALTQPFARLPDARGTVVVWPLVCLGLALAAELLARRGSEGAAPRAEAPAPRAEAAADPWRIGRGAGIGLALGAAILVHPVIGFLAVATVAIAALVRPRDLAPDAFVAAVTAGLVAMPQLATMIGVSLPTIALGVWLPIAVGAGVLLGRRIATRARLRDGLADLATTLRIPVLVVAVVGVLGAFGLSILRLDRVPAGLDETANLILESSGLLLLVLVAGAALRGHGARSPLVWSAAGVGAVAVFLTQVLPGDLGFLGSALRFEVPKTVHYWLSGVIGAGAATALAVGWATDRLLFLARALAIGAFVAVAAYPLRQGAPIDAAHLGEHRLSENLAIDLRHADRGYWVGYPDSRTIVDAPRQEMLDAVRAEIRAGRLRHDTPVLHVAKSFQQWSATPLGVFAGVLETFISLDPEVSHQTVGGRLYGSEDPVEMVETVADFLESGRYPYVVLEPDDLPADVRTTIEAAGYRPIFGNDQGEVFTRGG